MPGFRDQPRSERAWMIRTFVMALGVLFLFTISVGYASPASGANLTGQITAMRRSQLAYEAGMLSADARLRSLQHDRKRTLRKLRRSKAYLKATKSRRSSARDRADAARERLALAQDSIARQASFEDLADQARDAWLDGAVTAWLLNDLPTQPATPAGVSVAIEVSLPGPIFGSLLSQRTEPVPTPEQVRALKKQLRIQNRRLKKVQRKTRRVQRTRRAFKRHLVSVRRQRAVTLRSRGGNEAALKNRILSMSRLAVHRAAKRTKVRPGINSPFVWPARGRISQGYGCTGSRFSPARGSCRGFHDGIDVVAGYGSAVRSAGVGVISYIGRNPWDRGKRAFMVVVAHPGGYETLYAHVLPVRRVRVGQVVRKGQVIAFMGSTGHSTGTHLHLEIRRGRSTVNPLALL